MSDQHGSEFSFGRSARDVSDLPILAPDLVRSYQQPFHLRIHPDKWEFSEGKWVLQVERSHLRPGVGGVGGKEGNLNSYEDTALLQQWARHGDRRWVVIPNGDNRLRGIFGDNGNFLRSVEVQTTDNYGRHKVGPIIMAAWEKVTDLGQIETDSTMLAAYSAKLATLAFNIEGPSPRARQVVANQYVKLLNQLEATSQRGRDGGTSSLKKRINKIRRILAGITGDNSYLNELFEEGPAIGRVSAKKESAPKKAPAEKRAAITADDLAKALAQMSPEALQAILDAKLGNGRGAAPEVTAPNGDKEGGA